MREIKGYSKRKMKCNNTKYLLSLIFVSLISVVIYKTFFLNGNTENRHHQAHICLTKDFHCSGRYRQPDISSENLHDQ